MTVASLQLNNEWADVTSNSRPNQNMLSTLVKKYFSLENLEDFQVRCGKLGLEFRSKDKTQGYVFVGSLRVERDFETRMEKSRRYYNSIDIVVIGRKFVDYENELAGFSWRKK